MRIVIVILILTALAGGGYLASRSRPAPAAEVAGVVMKPASDYLLEDQATLSDDEALPHLVRLARDHPDRPRVGVHYAQGNRDLHLLLDRDADVITLWSVTARTRTETRWSGRVEDRLKWAEAQGTLSVPDLMPPISRNLYH